MTPTPHTAHDAAARAAFVATPAGTTIPSDERDYAWDFLLSDQSRSPWERQAAAVLAALGIPPTTPADDVAAAIVLLNAVHAGHLRLVGDASTPAVRAAVEHNASAHAHREQPRG